MLALDGCRLFRPSGLNDAVEIALADAKDRAFPARLAQTLGVCLKLGPAHEVWADGRRLTYPADAICVRGPGCIWSCDATGPVAFRSIDIDPSLLPLGLRSGPMRFVPRARLPSFGPALALLEPDRSPLARQSALAELVLELDGLISADALAPAGEPGASAAVRRARELLRARLESPPTLDELSAASGANKFVLLRRFKRELGITPHAYVVALRLDHARELLARGAHVADVAARLGFSDQAHFTRAFRKSLGWTPARYARAVRGCVASAAAE
jgi:AraC-like DNA-binding protein